MVTGEELLGEVLGSIGYWLPLASHNVNPITAILCNFSNSNLTTFCHLFNRKCSNFLIPSYQVFLTQKSWKYATLF